MFQSYLDIENNVVISSKEDEAFVNGWAMEINLNEVKKVIEEEEKKNHPIKYWFKSMVRRLRKCKK